MWSPFLSLIFYFLPHINKIPFLSKVWKSQPGFYSIAIIGFMFLIYVAKGIIHLEKLGNVMEKSIKEVNGVFWS